MKDQRLIIKAMKLSGKRQPLEIKKREIKTTTMICSFPGCKNHVPESKGLKPRIYCDDADCRKKRHNLEAKRSRDNIRKLYFKRSGRLL